MVQSQYDTKLPTMASATGKDGSPRRLAVLTSGGDSAGMNAAICSVVKMALYRGCETFIVREGWEGLVRGNRGNSWSTSSPDMTRPPSPVVHLADPVTLETRTDVESSGVFPKKHLLSYGTGQLLKEGSGDIDARNTMKGRYVVQVGWDDVRGWLDIGGTLIGTTRSDSFRTEVGRTKAALTLIELRIDALVVLGGDGSLTGADILRSQWPDLLKNLLDQGKISPLQHENHAVLNITGLVASIDNDYAGTDLTIGAGSALHRICGSIDSISATAASHSRAFVIEVMGRHCGWLTVMAAVSTGADFIFIPESPPEADWETEMCKRLQAHRSLGKRKTIVIVAEGAIDRELKPIRAEYVKKILEERLDLDTRVTTLGHVQRGGKPCAWDRILATRQGIEAVQAVLESEAGVKSVVIGIKENKIIRLPLLDSVAQTQQVAVAISAKNFDRALSLRDTEFIEGLKAFEHTADVENCPTAGTPMRIGILHVGAPAGGMNTATRAVVRYCLRLGHTPLGINSGIPGLLAGNVSELSWLKVDTWAVRGGSELGTNRILPDIDLAGVACAIEKHKIDAFLFIGGFEAFMAISQMTHARQNFRQFDVPMVHIPATISNNVPLTEFSLGSDTSLNALVDACDVIKQSAAASRNRVFVVETQGGYSGYLATLGALAVGAVIVYTPEVGISLKELAHDVEFLKRRYMLDPAGEREGRIVIRNEKSSKVYTTDVITAILSDEGGGLFDSRATSLGHTMQGGIPSPLDRSRAVRMAIRCVDFLQASHDAGTTETRTITIQGSDVVFASMEEMESASNMKRRMGKDEWWLRDQIKELVELMGGKTGLMNGEVEYVIRSRDSIYTVS